MHGFGRAIPDTCNGEKEKCEARGGWEVSCQKLLSKVAPCYKCYRVSCLVTFSTSSRLLLLSISELTLLI